MQVTRLEAHARQPLLQRLDTLGRVAAEVLDTDEAFFFVIPQKPHAVACGDLTSEAPLL